jgi:hypothetical protein
MLVVEAWRGVGEEFFLPTHVTCLSVYHGLHTVTNESLVAVATPVEAAAIAVLLGAAAVEYPGCGSSAASLKETMEAATKKEVAAHNNLTREQGIRAKDVQSKLDKDKSVQGATLLKLKASRDLDSATTAFQRAVEEEKAEAAAAVEEASIVVDMMTEDGALEDRRDKRKVTDAAEPPESPIL